MTTQDPFRVLIARRLKAARSRLDLTQQEVADAVDCSLTQFKAWERMRSVPPADKAAALCRVLGVSADYLLGLTDNEQGLRPGSVIVDQEALERFRFSVKADDAKAALQSAVDFLTFAKQVPGQARLMTQAEYVNLLRSLVPVFHRHKFPLPPEVRDEFGK